MESNDLNNHIDQQRWLMSNGFFNDMHKDNLYLFGALVHKNVLAVELKINLEKKLISYTLNCSSSLLASLSKYNKIKDSNKLLDMWKLKKLLKKEGNLNFSILIDGMIKNFCGPLWGVEVEVKNIDNYEEQPYKPDHEEFIKTD